MVLIARSVALSLQNWGLIMELNEFINKWSLSGDRELFFRAYIEAVYFTDTGDNDQPDRYAELTYDFLRQSAGECNRFHAAYLELIGPHTVKAGHDFWLTRNGHGAGFWDRPEVYGQAVADELTRACEFIGESDSDWVEPCA